MKRYVCLLAIIMACVQSVSWAGELRFTHLSTEQGLSHYNVRTFLQDSKGFLWIGTAEGLDKYNGHDFTVYKNELNDPQSLSNSFVNALYEDAEGFLWVGTNDGLNKFDPRAEMAVRYYHDPDDPNSLSNNSIQCLTVDRNGVLWFGTDDGINAFYPATGEFNRYRLAWEDAIDDNHNRIRAIFSDSSGVLWIGALDGGLSKFDPALGRVVASYRHNPDDPTSLSYNRIRSIAEDASGRLWVATDGGGLNLFDRENGTFTHYRHDPENPDSLNNDTIQSIIVDSEGVLWLGTDKGGLSRFDPQSGKFTAYIHDSNNPYSVCDNVLIDMYEDRQGTIWIATFNNGVSAFHRNAAKFTHYQAQSGAANGLSSNLIRAIHDDPSGKLWIGTDGYGLNVLNREAQAVHVYRHDSEDPNSIGGDVVLAIHRDASGTIWTGGYQGGLSKFEPETGTWTRYQRDLENPHSISSNFIRDITEDDSGNIWIGTIGGGLNKFDPQAEHFTHYQHNPEDPEHSLPNSGNLSLYFDAEAQIVWLGTFNGGLVKFDPATERAVTYVHIDGEARSLSDNTIWYILRDAEHNLLWLGTSGGLNKFDMNTAQVTYYTEKEGLPNNVVYAVLQDSEGFLWLSTNKGVCRFDPERETFKNYDTRDGLQDVAFSLGASYHSPSGEMFFGGNNGFNAFYPEQITDNPHIPPIALTSISQSGERLYSERAPEAVEEIHLDWQSNFFEFEFASLNYVFPEKNRYAYMLEGLDSDWFYVGERPYGRYTNLPGGHYTLKLRGTNNDGVWNEAGTSLTVVVTPPFWRTWWFYNLSAISILGLLVGIPYFRTRKLEQFNLALTQKVDERTAELAEANTEIRSLNERLKKENLRMSAELNVARQIQNMVLPSDTELQNVSDLAIAGFMIPADEVGGDYYDVLNSDSGVNFGIGDVTGHGLESGVLMLMTQTAIRTLLDHGENDPVRFLTSLNHTIYNNIQRMDVDKSLTLALVNYHEGRLTIVGQHEEIIVVRKGGTIELINTINLGMPLGLEEDISPYIAVENVQIEPGDGVVLFTDGITEAENAEQEFYGVQRLCQVLTQHWEQPVDDIKQAVIDNVHNFIGDQPIFDDLTLVVMKRK